MTDLPENWSEFELSEVLEKHQSGFACGKKNEKNGLIHLRMNNIGQDGLLDLTLIRKVPKDFSKNHSYLQKGDVLFCSTNSAKLVGKTALFDINGKFTFSNHLTLLRPNTRIILPQVLHLLLLFQWKNGAFEKDCKHWVNQSSLPKEKLLSKKLSIPPISEQRRIVAKLEKLLAKVGKCKERLEKIPIILKRFRQAVLKAACSGELTADWRQNAIHKPFSVENLFDYISKQRKGFGLSGENPKLSDSAEFPETWARVELSFFIESLANGIYKPEEFYADDGVACLRMYNIQDGSIRWTNIKRMKLTKAEIQKYELSQGDILINRVNSRELVGKSAFFSKYDESVIFESKNIRLKLIEKDVMPIYVNYCFQTRIVRDVFEERAKQTVGMATISQPQIMDLILPIPPLEEQKEIIDRVKRLFDVAEQLEHRYSAAAKYVSKLTQSILAKAFRGELVPQDPNDEPASELLKRIKAENEKPETAGKLKRRTNKFRP